MYRLVKVIVIVSVIMVIMALPVFAQYTLDTASPLEPNESATDSVTVEHLDNWWKITTESDGELVVTVTSGGTNRVNVNLYDANEYHLGNGEGETILQKTVERIDLGAGVYYVEINGVGEFGSYTVSNTFTPATYENDEEPNDSMTDPVIISTVSTYTGHVGYRRPDSYYDTEDWYQFTIDSKWDTLCVRVESDEELETWVQLFDSYGNHLANGEIVDESTASKLLTLTGREAGTYNLKIAKWGYSQNESVGDYAFIVSQSTATMPQILGAGGEITGIVIDQTTGLPVPFASVRVESVDTDFVPMRTTCDESGMYLCENVPDGMDYIVTAEADGYVYHRIEDVAVIAGETTTLYFSLLNDLLVGVEETLSIFSLSQNTPNPFNPITTIEYSIPAGNSERVKVVIYDLRGAVVRTLVDEMSSPGVHSVVWNGTDDSGSRVSSGIYLYKLQSGAFTKTHKMLLVK